MDFQALLEHARALHKTRTVITQQQFHDITKGELVARSGCVCESVVTRDH